MESGSEDNSSRKLRKCCDGGEVSDGNCLIPVDRISFLPESVIRRILSFLPTKSAVATSFLSKRWSLRWTKLTCFDYKDLLWSSGSHNSDGEDENGDEEGSYSGNRGHGISKMDFVGFVNMVLLHQDAENTIDRFHLEIKNRSLRNSPIITWVSTAIIRNVRVLELDASSLVDDDDVDSDDAYDDYHEYEFHLPVALYTCGSLEVLKLKGAFLVKVPRVVSLPKLTVLELVSVRYQSDECIRRLISGSPMLQTLAVDRYHSDDGMTVCTISSPVLKRLRYFHESCENCDSPDDHDSKLKIDAPALEYLSLKDFLLEKVTLRGLTSLNEVVLEIPSHVNTVELVQAFVHVKYLTLCDFTVRNLSEATKKLSSSFDNVTKLVVRVQCCELSYLMNLIDLCATLKVLQIEKVQSFPIHNDCWKAPNGVPR
ncbi:OLC1v1019426C1 [Oldenlandia corymbosa var. corymbosa]|uniref:OLC1v1019426C1 n=1 Tax=Oldenlandia corymbosa var. corymbosa TaxID=529605 RepID=A0AAV1EE22_OLDCO|nr:OLC1v1019426C1 [Oldenlandia corymbosa var. corymbosa]